MSSVLGVSPEGFALRFCFPLFLAARGRCLSETHPDTAMHLRFSWMTFECPNFSFHQGSGFSALLVYVAAVLLLR